MSATTRVLVARLGHERIAIDVAVLAEVLDAPEIQPLPLVPPGVLGQLGWRGGFVPVLDPGVLLGVPRSAQPGRGAALVLRDVGAALWVDDAEDVWAPEEAERRPVPAGSDRLGVLRALLARGDDVVAHVDAPALVAAVSTTLRQGPL